MDLASVSLIGAPKALIIFVTSAFHPAALRNGDVYKRQGLLEYPQYTRPQVWDGQPIPEVLVSGDHGKIAAWRREESRRRAIRRAGGADPGA